MGETLKRCKKCGEEKALNDFYFDYVGQCYASPCKACRNARKQAREAGKVSPRSYPSAKDGLKACMECGQPKPATEDFFYVRKFGPMHTCKDCLNARRTRAKREKQEATKGADGCQECSKCHKKKPATAEYFGPHKRRAGGLQSFCLECSKEVHEDIQAKKREALLLRPKQEERVCTGCHEVLPLTIEFFSRSTKQRTQFAPKCKKCRSKERREAYEELKKDIVAYSELLGKFQEARAKRLNAPGQFTGHDIRQLFIQQKGCCFYCGVRITKDVKWHIDHYIPISRGGTNFPDNLVVACQPCNNSKWNRMPWEWMPERFSPPPSTQ